MATLVVTEQVMMLPWLSSFCLLLVTLLMVFLPTRT